MKKVLLSAFILVSFLLFSQEKTRIITNYPFDRDAFLVGISLLERETFDLSLEKLGLEYFQDYQTDKYAKYVNQKDSKYKKKYDKSLEIIKDSLKIYRARYRKKRSGNFIKLLKIGSIDEKLDSIIEIDIDLEPDILYKVREYKTFYPFKVEKNKRTSTVVRLKFENALDFSYIETIKKPKNPKKTDNVIFLNIIYKIHNLELYYEGKDINFKLECKIKKIDVYDGDFSEKLGEILEE